MLLGVGYKRKNKQAPEFAGRASIRTSALDEYYTELSSIVTAISEPLLYSKGRRNSRTDDEKPLYQRNPLQPRIKLPKKRLRQLASYYYLVSKIKGCSNWKVSSQGV
jgi:hypothetical protein